MGTAKACYICNKPTTTVLATINTVDFIYACDNHLTDPGFATQVGESADGGAGAGAKKVGLSAEEIAKVKEEWEERQKKKKEKEKEEGDKDKDKDKEKEANDKNDKSKASSPKASAVSTPSPQPSTPTPSHQRYTLHRDIFAMRLAEHRKRRQTAQAKELAPRLPGAPRGAIPPS